MAFLSVRDGRVKSTNGKGKKLTPKMLDFIDHYMVNQNGAEAHRASGYKSNNPARAAWLLLQHPLVQEEVAKRLTKRSEKMEVKADYLINKLINIIEDTQTDNPAACLRAIELAGKSIALWKERQEISGPDGEAIKHEQHIKESVSDFTSRISGLAKRAGTDNVVGFPNRSRDGGTSVALEVLGEGEPTGT